MIPRTEISSTERAPNVFASAAEHSRDLLSASFRTWAEEVHSFSAEWVRDGADALKGLAACRTPIDLLVLEQHWLLARSQAYVDAGVRLLTGTLHEAERAAAESAAFKLPE